MSYVCLHVRGESRNELPSAFTPALQLTWSHASLRNDVSLPNWLVRWSYTTVFIFRYRVHGKFVPDAPRHPSLETSGTNCVARSTLIALVIVTVGQRVLTALILANKFAGESERRARGLFYRGGFAVEIFARAG